MEYPVAIVFQCVTGKLLSSCIFWTGFRAIRMVFSSKRACYIMLSNQLKTLLYCVPMDCLA